MSLVVNAAGFVLDVPVIGTAEAADRVLAGWRDGAELRELPDGRWLFTLPEPVETPADRASGQPLRSVGGGLTAVGLDQAAGLGELLITAGGLTIRHVITELRLLNPSDWLDLSGITLHRLGAVGTPVVSEPVREDVPRPPAVDLRAAARIPESTVRARRLNRDASLSDEPSVGSAAWGLIAAVVLLVVVVWAVLMAGLVARRGFHLGAFLLSVGAGCAVLLGFGLRDRRVRRVGGTVGGRSNARPSARRTPTGSPLSRRHLRYLRDLTRAFEERRWEDALRDAIRLDGGDTGGRPYWFSRRLPRRFAGPLRPTPDLGDRPRVVGPISGPTVHRHLTDLYRQAAETLDREGRIDEAAFVLADLLGTPAEAVALLDRHGRTAQAAELAEGRRLAPDLVVRLWWRAGERERAVRIAHHHAAFAPAVERLTDTDPRAARDLRAAWVEHCRTLGDRLGAVEAAWPDETLRPTVAADLRDAVALGGPVRGRALAHLLALGAGDATRGLARTVLDGGGEASGCLALATALADLPAADPAADRELTTAALRAAVRAGGFDGSHDVRTERALYERLLKRADPLAGADLLRPRRSARPVGEGPVGEAPVITAADRPGTLPVRDAARLDSGAVLVACGQAGVRLLAPDGRTRVRWDVPADQLVLADHGGTALLVARYGEVHEIVHLDLATRAVRPWTALRVREIVPSFDGRLLITVDEDGITVLDTHTPRPTAVWRELGGGQRTLGRIARSSAGCTAVVQTRAEGRMAGMTELWHWDQPGWELRSRHALNPADAADAVTLADGRLLGSGPAGLRWTGEKSAADLPVDGEGALHSDAAWWAFTHHEAGAQVTAGTGTTPAFTALFPGADAGPVGIRHHGGAVTLWHHSGRVLAAAPDGATVLANLRVTAS
ncbi:bpX6 domain-containing protein [Kitasatospora aureofaciens]|uniref:bpX6 domain-containing protein n=1 Tax=Kitasatospora aureofaciens TaxID=1894 RepID=UPI001C468EEC|nr:bpX6 domain-containing protein [Kitasatospora aureofaciens]MBV6699147.1 hypothetical protein [Kitasatospora aureofaciens]